MRSVLLVHAGAGTWKYLDRESIIATLENALETGLRALTGEGSAIAGAVEATKVLEDSGILNAGIGSVVDLSGHVSMDAGVMDGYTGRAGAVASVTYPRNPVVLALKVMELTDHILIAGSPADDLARRLGLEKHPGPSQKVLKRYKEYIMKGYSGPYVKSYELAKKLGIGDTVGAVAVDSKGRVAAAVSTGGVMLKFPGRVGDSAIPGAGFYANRAAAAVATGIGETIIESFLTLSAVNLVAEGLSASTAAKMSIMKHTSISGPDTAGVIVVSSDGDFGAFFNTNAMPWGYITSDGKLGISGLPKK